MTRKFPLLLATAGLSLACAACAPQWLLSLHAQPKRGYEVGYPPPDKVEVIPPAPGAGYVWIQGHWLWHDNLNDYRWVPGRWEHVASTAPANEDAHDAGRHEGDAPHDGGMPVVYIVYVSRRPPKAKREVAPPRPHHDDVWVPGHWTWENRAYRWAGGGWVQPPEGYHAWVSGRWAHEKRGWHYVDGHWR